MEQIIGKSSNRLVSIITPAYNSMEYIFETIDSVLIQDYNKIEYIICDDCSKQFDAKTIRDYINEHKKDNLRSWMVYQNEHNLGTVKNLNEAFMRSHGEIIIILSADDLFFDKTIISKLVQEMDKQNCDFLVTRRAAFNNKKDEILGLLPTDQEIRRIKKIKSTIVAQKLMPTCFIWGMASGSVFCYTAEAFKKVGMYDERYRLWEDGPFAYNYLSYGKMIGYNYDIVSIYYRMGGVSTSQHISPKLAKDMMDFADDIRREDSCKGYYRRIVNYFYEYSKLCYEQKYNLINLKRVCYLDVMIYKILINLLN